MFLWTGPDSSWGSYSGRGGDERQWRGEKRKKGRTIEGRGV